MTEREELLRALEEEMLPKIYGFCVLKMNTSQETEDLAQEICIEVLKVIRSGKPIENLNAFVWSVSNHMFYNYLRRKKYGTTVYLSDLLAGESDPAEEYILEEQKALLRRELALMTGDYRRVMILHYFENRSCEEIGAVLGKSAGTVRWWLHDARKKIEKGMNKMREFGEKSFHPGALSLSCQGFPGNNFEPMSCAERKSTQNILLAAYKAPVSVGELCTELGIAAVYVEDEIAYLVENQLMREVSRGKFQTDFVILPKDDGEIADRIYDALFPAYYEKLITFLEARKETLTSGRYNPGGFTWDRLLWVYLCIVTDSAINRYKAAHAISVEMSNFPFRPKGGRWIALGFDGSAGTGDLYPKKAYHEYNGPLHKVEGEVFAQYLMHTWSDCTAEEFFEIPVEVLELCGEVIRGKVRPEEMDRDRKYLFSIALEKRLFVETPSGFRQNFFFVEWKEQQEIVRMAHAFYEESAELYEKAYDMILQWYVKTIPPHLHWQMGNFLSFKLNYLATCSLYEALRQGILSEPGEEDRKWLSLFVVGQAQRTADGEV